MRVEMCSLNIHVLINERVNLLNRTPWLEAEVPALDPLAMEPASCNAIFFTKHMWLLLMGFIKSALQQNVVQHNNSATFSVICKLHFSELWVVW